MCVALGLYKYRYNKIISLFRGEWRCIQLKLVNKTCQRRCSYSNQEGTLRNTKRSWRRAYWVEQWHQQGQAHILWIWRSGAVPACRTGLCKAGRTHIKVKRQRNLQVPLKGGTRVYTEHRKWAVRNIRRAAWLTNLVFVFSQSGVSSREKPWLGGRFSSLRYTAGDS